MIKINPVQIHKKEEVKKHQEIAQSLADKEAKRKETILEEQGKHDERVQKLIEERQKRIRAAQKAELERISAVAERKSKNNANDNELQEKMEKKDQEAAQRIADMRRQNEIKRLNNIADQLLLQKTMEDNSKALARKRQYEQEEIARKKQEREQKALRQMQMNQNLGKKRREQSIQTTFKRTEIINSFKEFMKEGGNPDVEELARKYNIDLESLKSKVEGKSSGSGSLNNTGNSFGNDDNATTASSLPPLQ